METKVCNRCKQEKPISEFGLRKDSKDGLRYSCKQCDSEKAKKYRDNHKEKLNDHRKEYVIKNKDKIKKRQKEWYLTNTERISGERKDYRLENKDIIKERQHKFHIKNHLKCLIKDCFKRAKKNNLPYDSLDILYDYLSPIYDIGECECCHRKLVYNNESFQDNSFSIDKIVPVKGYVIGNVATLLEM